MTISAGAPCSPSATPRARSPALARARWAHDQPKFLNSPQTPLFDKSASLFGIDHARETIRSAGQAVIVEGYLDVLIAHQMGINNVVASLGTALTERQLSQLKRLGKSLVLALDADAAGDEATLRGLTVARDVMDRVPVPVATWRGLVHFEYRLDADLRILSLPRGEDPDEVILRSVDEWRQLVQQAMPVVDFYFRPDHRAAGPEEPKGQGRRRRPAPAADQGDRQPGRPGALCRAPVVVGAGR